MKKSFYIISFLILLIVVFFGGVRFNQSGIGQRAADTVERQILHYVDPMNPAHTSTEPGIAPCGMPMEPVYADKDTPGGSVLPTSLGAVTINLQKQQIIGVQIGEVVKTAETSTIRALGRIAPDENRVYPLIAPTDGWMEEINESTTGSLVSANQLMAQSRYTTMTSLPGNNDISQNSVISGSTNVSASPLSGADQGRRRVTSGSGYQAGLPPLESEIRTTRRAANMAQMNAGSESSSMTESSHSAPEGEPRQTHQPTRQNFRPHLKMHNRIPSLRATKLYWHRNSSLQDLERTIRPTRRK